MISCYLHLVRNKHYIHSSEFFNFYHFLNAKRGAFYYRFVCKMQRFSRSKSDKNGKIVNYDYIQLF